MSDYDFKCLKCGYEWRRREKSKKDFRPKCCPNCQSRKWGSTKRSNYREI